MSLPRCFHFNTGYFSGSWWGRILYLRPLWAMVFAVKAVLFVLYGLKSIFHLQALVAAACILLTEPYRCICERIYFTNCTVLNAFNDYISSKAKTLKSMPYEFSQYITFLFLNAYVLILLLLLAFNFNRLLFYY